MITEPLPAHNASMTAKHAIDTNFQKFCLFPAEVNRAGVRTRLQLLGHGDMQRFNSSSLAFEEVFSEMLLFSVASLASLALRRPLEPPGHRFDPHHHHHDTRVAATDNNRVHRSEAEPNRCKSFLLTDCSRGASNTFLQTNLFRRVRHSLTTSRPLCVEQAQLSCRHASSHGSGNAKCVKVTNVSPLAGSNPQLYAYDTYALPAGVSRPVNVRQMLTHWLLCRRIWHMHISAKIKWCSTQTSAGNWRTSRLCGGFSASGVVAQWVAQGPFASPGRGFEPPPPLPTTGRRRI